VKDFAGIGRAKETGQTMLGVLDHALAAERRMGRSPWATMTASHNSINTNLGSLLPWLMDLETRNLPRPNLEHAAQLDAGLAGFGERSVMKGPSDARHAHR